MTLLQSIIVRSLVWHDAVLSIFVGSPTYTAGNLSNCGAATVTAGELTSCGIARIAQYGELVVQGISLLNRLLEALNTISS